MFNQSLIIYYVLMIIASLISTYGTFVTLPFKDLDQWSAIKMALPYAWVDWTFITFAVDIGKDLTTPTQIKFTLTTFKMFLILLFTKYYLQSKVTRSDIVGFLIVLAAYLMHLFDMFSILFGIPVEKPTIPPTK
jgi:uncharacterized protein (DUF486 family)